MAWIRTFVILLCSCNWISTTETPCRFELQCTECVPDHMPLVKSHQASGGLVVVRDGEEVLLSCGASRFVAFPLRASLIARCRAGRLRAAGDARDRHILDFACQQDMFEDVLHAVESCAPPLQGRAYQLQDANGTQHVAAACFDEDRGIPVFTFTNNAPANELRMPPHSDRHSPLTLFGNLNGMFDADTLSIAEKLYSDDERLNRRLHELFKHDEVSFAAQRLTSGRLLAPHYFEDQNMRVSDFASNKAAVWGSVAEGNLLHLQRDVSRLLREARPGSMLVAAGTHGAGALRAGGGGARLPVRLRGERFSVPRYLWTLVVGDGRALVVLLLNEPFVAVSEVREAVPCESVCSRVSWLRELRHAHRFETPIYGLAACCSAHEAAALMPEIPMHLLASIPQSLEGLLTDVLV